MFQLIFFTGTPFGTPQTPMNTRFYYILFQCSININNKEYRMK